MNLHKEMHVQHDGVSSRECEGGISGGSAGRCQWLYTTGNGVTCQSHGI